MAIDVTSVFAGAIGGVGSAVVVGLFSRGKVRAESQKALGEAKKASAEAEKASAEAAEIRERIRNVDARAANAPEVGRALTVFSSRAEGFGPAFKTERWDGADGNVVLETNKNADDTLIVRRINCDGTFVVWLTSYAYQGGVNVIPADPGGAVRKLRVQCQLQAAGAQLTAVLVLKQLGSPPGAWLDSRRHRLASNAWVPIDEHFRVNISGDARLRFLDRTVSAAPSSLLIRDVVVTEYDAPAALRPS